jgi:hypothetical protein
MTFPNSRQPLGWPHWRWYVFVTAIPLAISLLISIPLVAVMAVLVSPLTFFLWNSLMPTLFGLEQISWLQAVGLFLLTRLLFSSSK